MTSEFLWLFLVSNNDDDDEGETIEFSNIPTEASALAKFAQKTAAD